MVCVDLHFSSGWVRFFTVYHPPYYTASSREYMSNLTKLLSNTFLHKASNVIVGDFNCPDVDWVHYNAPDDGIQLQLIDCFNSLGVMQFVLEPTRGLNILDIVLTNDPLLVTDLEILPPVGTSDHSSLSFSLHLSADSSVKAIPSLSRVTDEPSSLPLRFPIWEKANFAGLLTFFLKIDWYTIISTNLTPDSLWNAYYDILWEVSVNSSQWLIPVAPKLLVIPQRIRRQV